SALRLSSAPGDEAVEAVASELRSRVRQLEQAAAGKLLTLYGFAASDLAGEDLPDWHARLDMDLFHPEAMKQMGVHVGKGIAAGAAAGAAVDLFTGGLSLGA